MSDMGANLKIYPSGFVGPADVQQTTPVSAATVMRSLMSRQVNPNLTQYTSAQEVDDLMDSMSNLSEKPGSFEFRERVIRLAWKLLFPGAIPGDFIDLASAQRAYGDYSDLHRRWLEETIRFVEFGTARTVQNLSWVSILTAGGSNHTNITLSQNLITDLGRAYRYEGTTAYYRATICLSKWIHRPNGVQDLLDTMAVLYGSR